MFALGFDSISFYENNLSLAGKYLVNREIIEYEDIENIYYLKARYNEYGEKIDRSSYVLHMKNDDYIDLDGYTSIEVSEKEILPLLNLEVISVESERELDWYK